MKTLRLAALLLIASLAARPSLAADRKNHYWEWGWGTYGLGADLSRAGDIARYDWSLVCIAGGDPCDQTGVNMCNEVLRLNPKHKFVIRLWPIGALGDCPENSNQATFLDYLYVPGVREKLLQAIRDQLGVFLKGVANPRSIAGSVFLEELPGHFSSAAFGGPGESWKQGDPLPWDIKRFEKQIAADYGGPVDWSSEQFRYWWGRKWVQVINEINQTMKQASGNRLVLYYQMTGWSTLDAFDSQLPIFKGRPVQFFVPIHYADIVKPGLCDGIFGYPNNKDVWEQQTLAVVNKLHCLFFSQTSWPPGMRLCHLDEMIKLAATRHPGNLGSFCFLEAGRKTKAWNAIDYQDESSFWTYTDHSRHFGWTEKLNLDVVDRFLAPEVGLDINLAGVKRNDVFAVQGYLRNTRDASWFGGSNEVAVLKRTVVRLEPPKGFSVSALENPSGPMIINNIQGGDAIPLVWYVRSNRAKAELAPGEAFRVTVDSDHGLHREFAFGPTNSYLSPFRPHRCIRSGETWLEPAYRVPPNQPTAVDLTPLAKEPLDPELVNGDQHVVFRDLLRYGTRLRIGPGRKATLYPVGRFDESVRHFAPGKPGPDGAVVFQEGYVVFGTGITAPVCSGNKYKLQLTGYAKDGAGLLLLAYFNGYRNQKWETVPVGVGFKAGLTDKIQTIESEPVEVPAFDGDEGVMGLVFYRAKVGGDPRGALCLKEFACERADMPPTGLDVTAKLEGALPALTTPFSFWQYQDQNDPHQFEAPKIEIRFVDVNAKN